MILEEAIRLFLDSRKRGTGGAKKKATPATIEIYQRNLEIFCDFMVSKSFVSYEQIKRTSVMDFNDWLDEKEKSGQWSKSTCLQMLRTLRTFFRWVDRDEDMQEDGLKGMQKYLPVVGKTPRRTDIPQIKDLKRMKGSFQTNNLWGFRDYVFTCLMLDTGIRVGEVCNLELTHLKVEEKHMIVDGKTGPRAVGFSNEMARLFKTWLKRRQSAPKAAQSAYVFVSKGFDKMTPNGVGQRYRKLMKKHDLPRITAHSLRHSMATNYLSKGGNMEKLRIQTGHASYAMLSEYVHLATVKGSGMQEELDKVSLLKDM